MLTIKELKAKDKNKP